MKSFFKKIRSAFDSADIPVFVQILAFILIDLGGTRLRNGAGHLILGFILLLYVTPLSRWIK